VPDTRQRHLADKVIGDALAREIIERHRVAIAAAVGLVMKARAALSPDGRIAD